MARSSSKSFEKAAILFLHMDPFSSTAMTGRTFLVEKTFKVLFRNETIRQDFQLCLFPRSVSWSFLQSRIFKGSFTFLYLHCH